MSIDYSFYWNGKSFDLGHWANGRFILNIMEIFRFMSEHILQLSEDSSFYHLGEKINNKYDELKKLRNCTSLYIKKKCLKGFYDMIDGVTDEMRNEHDWIRNYEKNKDIECHEEQMIIKNNDLPDTLLYIVLELSDQIIHDNNQLLHVRGSKKDNHISLEKYKINELKEIEMLKEKGLLKKSKELKKLRKLNNYLTRNSVNMEEYHIEMIFESAKKAKYEGNVIWGKN